MQLSAVALESQSPLVAAAAPTGAQTGDSANNRHRTGDLSQSFIKTRVRGQRRRKSCWERRRTAAPSTFSPLSAVWAYLPEEAAAGSEIKSLWLVFTHRAKLMIRKRKNKEETNPLIFFRRFLCEESPGGRESEGLAAALCWLRGDPWQDTVSDVMRM